MKSHIKDLSKLAKLSQAELAKLCKVSRQTINAIENDKYGPTLRLAFVQNTTVDELFINKNSTIGRISGRRPSAVAEQPARLLNKFCVKLTSIRSN